MQKWTKGGSKKGEKSVSLFFGAAKEAELQGPEICKGEN